MSRSLKVAPGPGIGHLGGWLLPAILILALLPGLAAGLTWDHVPSASAGAGYETNPSRSAQDEKESFVITGNARLSIRGESSTLRATFLPELQAASYTDLERDDRDDNYVNYFLPLSVSRSWQNAMASFSGGYSRVSTRDSVIVRFDPNTPPQPGIDTADRRTEYQERWYFSPSFRYRLTPMDSLGVSLRYDDMKYTEAEYSWRSNYKSGSADLSWDHTLNPRSTISLGLNASGFEAKRPDSPYVSGLPTYKNDTVTYGFSAGYQFALTSASMVGLTAGASRSDVEIKGLPWISTPAGPMPCLDPVQHVFVPCTLKSSGDNFIGEVFFRQRTAQTVTTELRLSRSIQPSSDGSQVTLDQAAAYLTKEFTPLLSGRLALLYWQQDAVVRQAASVLSNHFNRDYYSLEASATWRLNRSWSVISQYTYTDDQYNSTSSPYSVSNHRFYIYLRYSGLGNH